MWERVFTALSSKLLYVLGEVIYMNNKEREEFWNVLLTLKNEADSEKLLDKIKYPDKLYRYRSVNIKTLNALADNKLYFSTPNYYDDPFDTFIRIDIKKLQNYARCFENQNIPAPFLPLYKYIPKENLLKENLDIILNNAISFVKESRNKIRKHIWSLCFTEKYSNENLWLKYANAHKGFVLEYDVNSLNNIKFNTELPARLAKCGDVKMSLYPIYYAEDENVYDATAYAIFIDLCNYLEKTNRTPLIQELVSKGIFMWEMEKIILIKKCIHHYDEEWRLVLNSQYRIESSAKPYIFCKPSKIILGLKMSDDDKQAVLRASKEADINYKEQMIIDSNDEFTSEKLLN